MRENTAVSKKVAFYHGCFANYYYPEVGRALVEVMKNSKVEVIVPEQACCALPMIAKGNIKAAYDNMEFNVQSLCKALDEGYVPLSTCPSCSLMIKRDYPRFLKTQDAVRLGQSFLHFSEYLLELHGKGELSADLHSRSRSIFYHTPCHLRAQQIGQPSVKLMQLIRGISVKQGCEVCCGMGGAYGFEKVNYNLSKNIAAKLYGEIEENSSDLIATDCGGCKLQIEAGTARKVIHPIILLKESLLI